jgi:hypothetical protein
MAARPEVLATELYNWMWESRESKRISEAEPGNRNSRRSYYL